MDTLIAYGLLYRQVDRLHRALPNEVLTVRVLYIKLSRSLTFHKNELIFAPRAASR